VELLYWVDVIKEMSLLKKYIGFAK